jgi:putative ABC transport system permease protein
MTIVGVVDDVTPADEPERPALYVPIDQTPIGSGELVVRSEGDPQTIIPVLAARLRTVAPSLAFDRIRPVTQVLAESRAVTRFSMQLANAFAVLSLLLAMIGIYGLTSGDVTTRWRELAVRLALGATRQNALWTVLGPCVTVLGGGAALGLVGAMSVSPLLASLLHGVAPRDTLTLIAAPLVLALVGVSAALLAGVRILRADPAATLRNE